MIKLLCLAWCACADKNYDVSCTFLLVSKVCIVSYLCALIAPYTLSHLLLIQHLLKSSNWIVLQISKYLQEIYMSVNLNFLHKENKIIHFSFSFRKLFEMNIFKTSVTQKCKG